jgi:hypothetical protein
MFIKYPHLERFGTEEVQDIDLGECYVFPKIDGTNASIWLDGQKMCCGSRNRELSLDSDNAGFMAWAVNQEKILKFLREHPNLRLYGEWLVPHALKTYREDTWRNFYVFDVGNTESLNPDGEGTADVKFIHYEVSKPLLEAAGIDYIPAICKVSNGTIDFFHESLDKNQYLIKDGEGCGEGIVVKNYYFKNKYGRTTWAKLIRNEFKELHARVNDTNEISTQKLIEEEIIKKYVTTALVEKELEKIKLEKDGWHSKCIPQLLNTVFYCLVHEESWNFVKEHNMPRIDFRLLQRHCFAHIKSLFPQLF